MRLIDADALLSQAFTTMVGFDAVLVDDIVNAPTIDAVPVVRCGQCKYRDEDNEFCYGRGFPNQLVAESGM